MRLLPTLLALSALSLAACKPQVDLDDTGTGGGPGGGSGGGGDLSTAVLATVAEDYSVGALATVDLDDWSVTDGIVDVSGDVATVASGGRIFHLDRYGYDTVRIYEPGEWGAPEAEFALADLANPHDVEVCAGKAFITQHGATSLAIHDPDTGAELGAVDLSAWADADGLPEASGAVLGGDGRLYVAVQSFDRDNGWASAGGAVLAVDCEAEAVVESWELASPSVTLDHADDSRILVEEQDVGLFSLDLATGELSEPLITEEALGAGLGGVAAWGDRAVITTVTEDYRYTVACLELDGSGEIRTLEESENYLIGLVGNAAGEAWIAARTHWATAEDPPPNGAIVYDIESCTSLTAGAPIETLLAPMSITFY